MSGEQKIRVVAIALVIFTTISIVLLLALTGGASIVFRVIRLVLACVFAFFLVREATWARWLVGISSGFGAVLSIIGWFGMGGTSISMFSILGIWMLVMAVFYGWVAFMLLLDKDVSHVFSPPSGF